jgi:lipoyl(octanoyl) transferase
VSTPGERPLSSYYLGRRPYAAVHGLMQELVLARQRGLVPDTVLLLEHEAVITLGRGGKREHVLAASGSLEELGIQVEVSGRGGDVTLHAPGQLVAYPIFDLAPDRQDVRRYVRDLTSVMNALLAPYDVCGGTVSGLIGLWVDAERAEDWPGEAEAKVPQKIGAIGVRISRWVTSHGFALNLTTDLDLFRLIVPCGISTRGVTSLERLTGQRLDVRSAAEQAAGLFCRHFDHVDASFRDVSALDEGELQGLVLPRLVQS